MTLPIFQPSGMPMLKVIVLLRQKIRLKKQQPKGLSPSGYMPIFICFLTKQRIVSASVF